MKEMALPPELRRIRRAQEILEIEIQGVESLKPRLDRNFSQTIDLLKERRGKIIVAGIGKSGVIARKFAATLTSTGNPAVFLHPAEGLHGDLGIVQRGDVAVLISYSGESMEIMEIVRALDRLLIPIIAVTGAENGFLAEHATVTLNVRVPREACPLNLAPTASTTATLALLDAIALVLMEESGFTPEEFAEFHPGGKLGLRLKKVSDLMHTGEEVPLVTPETPMEDVLVEMTSKRLGITGVAVDGKLVGVITDGDLRRALKRFPDLLKRTAGEIMTHHPKTIPPSTLVEKAIALMEEHKITCLFVVDEEQKVIGVIHMHDLISRGVR